MLVHLPVDDLDAFMKTARSVAAPLLAAGALSIGLDTWGAAAGSNGNSDAVVLIGKLAKFNFAKRTVYLCHPTLNNGAPFAAGDHLGHLLQPFLGHCFGKNGVGLAEGIDADDQVNMPSSARHRHSRTCFSAAQAKAMPLWKLRYWGSN